ncbi:MAG: efflux RND transporter permease subunit [bacterium]
MQNDKGIIAWFAKNSVAANLLMVVILVAGISQAFTIQKQTFPDFKLNRVQVTVPLPGASPEDVEEGIVLKVEEAIQDIEGITKLNSTASEGFANITAEIDNSYDLDNVLNEIKMRVDGIFTFPEQAEKPTVSRVSFRRSVIWLSVYGDTSIRTLQEYAQQLKDELIRLDEVSAARVVGARAYEISIEIPEETLHEYKLTLNEIASKIRLSSLDLPGGTIKTEGGDIRIRTKGKAYWGEEFSNIIIRQNRDGTRIMLGDIATVNDGFAETSGGAFFDGQQAINLEVTSTGDDNDIDVSNAVKTYLEKNASQVPEGIKVASWGDSSFYLKGRLNMMLTNLFYGAVLVFIILTLFLRLKMAFWVMVGIPISFLGALWLMPSPPFDININLLSLFAFIMVLGIVVDDAIIIAESIYTETKKHGHTMDNVIRGAQKVAMPATFGVLTTIAAFAPMLFLESQISVFFKSIGAVVVLALLFSLIESKLILPTHLAHMKIKPIKKNPGLFGKTLQFCAQGMENFANHTYARWLDRALEYRYVTMSVFAGILFVTVGLFTGGFIHWNLFPNVPNDFPQANLTMQDGTPASQTKLALARIEKAAHRVEKEYQQDHPDDKKMINHFLWFVNSDTSGGVVAELSKAEQRSMDTFQFVDKWRKYTGEIPGMKDLSFQAGTNAGGGAPLNFRLTGSNSKNLELAANELSKRLATYDGVFDIQSTVSSGTEEIKISLKPSAENLGLTQSVLAQQVRQAFFGAEAQRIQRGRDEVKVMVRYPKQERHSLASLQNMWIRTQTGDEIPLSEVAELKFDKSYTSINRVNQQRSVNISADIDSERVESGKLVRDISSKDIPEILKRYPGVHYKLAGASLEQKKMISEIMWSFLAALFLIYGLIAIPLKSYAKPVVVMSAIPFGIVGAIIGHLLLGKAASMMSAFGIIALAGVVVNDSLVMVDFINRGQSEGMKRYNAVKHAGIQRFRAIVLTSLTTFVGVVPIYFETSLQAQFIIPMAISLGFGILFATVITLFLIPSLYLIAADIKGIFATKKPKSKNSQTAEQTTPA